MSKKSKVKLEDLELKSFVTSMADTKKQTVVGKAADPTLPSGCTGCDACNTSPPTMKCLP